jgi:hypothetical protein
VERFFILGCQRTGTTLLRLILEAHPDVVCYDEIKGYEILQSSVVEDFGSARLVGFKLPRWTEQLTRPVLFDEGAEGVCRNFYRGERILFLQRDVRDTISSMLKLRAGQASWCELWVPRIIGAKLAWESAFRTQYAEELAIIDSCSSRLVGQAALYWKYKNDALLEYRKKGLPVLTVSYEDLVRNPRPVLQSVCRHLGIAFHENLLRHGELPHTELFANGLAVGNTNPKLPIQDGSVGQWERFLSKEDLHIVERIAGERIAGTGMCETELPRFCPATPESSPARAALQ